ncbi:MAG TPA: ABC transporter permease [Acidimicrobiia bacterium]
MSVSAPQGISYRARRLRTYLTDLWGRREFAWFLAMGNLKARNASTALGLIWWVLNPLLLGLVYFFVFGVLFAGSSRPPDYIAYLLSGMFVFYFTSQSMTGGANAILQNAKLLANLKFPRMVLLISSTIESIVGFLASLLVYFAIVWPITGIHPTRYTLLLVVIFPVQVLFNVGLSAIVARMAVPFRDINNFIPYINRIWLYLSPIIWQLSFLDNASPAIKTVVEINPMFHIIELYRAALIGHPNYVFDINDLWVALAWAVVVFVVGVAGFIRYETRMVRYL